MSSYTLKDGTGNGFTQKVDNENRAYTYTTTETNEEHSVAEGTAWNLNTLDMVLSSDTGSATQYIKNTGNTDLIIQRWVVVTGPSTGGASTDNVLVEIVRNPDSVSFSTSLQPFNSNFGSNDQPEALTYKGGEGETITGGDVVIASRMTAGTRNILPVVCIVPQGTSAAIRVTPPSGNTNMIVQSVIVAYERS